MQVLTAPFAVAADALSFFGSALLVGRIPVSEAAPAPGGPSVPALLREGLALVFRHPVQRAALGCTTTVNFFTFIAEELREIMAKLGFRTVDEMIGRSDLLDTNRALGHFKTRGLDFGKVFHRPQVGPQFPGHLGHQVHHVGVALDFHQLGYADRPRTADPADVIATQIHQHDVLGALFFILG